MISSAPQHLLNLNLYLNHLIYLMVLQLNQLHLNRLDSSQILPWWFLGEHLIHLEKLSISLTLFNIKLQAWVGSRCLATCNNLHNNNSNQILWLCNNNRWQCSSSRWLPCLWVVIPIILRCNKCKHRCKTWCKWCSRWWWITKEVRWILELKWTLEWANQTLWLCNNLRCLRWIRMPDLLRCSRITRQCLRKSQKIA